MFPLLTLQPSQVLHPQSVPSGEQSAMLRGLMDQNPSLAPIQVWDGTRLFQPDRNGLREIGTSEPRLNLGQPPTDMAWYFTYDLVDGVAYAWGSGDDRASGQKGADLKEVRRTLYIYRNGGSRWELWDTLQARPDAFISWMRPLEGGGYLLGGRFSDPEMHRADPLAVAKRDGHGRLAIHETEDPDLGAPAFIRNQSLWMHNPKLLGALDALMGPFARQARVPGHIVLVGKHLGIFIVINARTGRIQRTARLFSALPDDAMSDPAAYEYGLLGVQPRPDGHLLIAARSGDAVAQSRAWRPDLPPLEPVQLSFTEAFGQSAEDQNDRMEEKRDAADRTRSVELQEARLRQFPDLDWWDFNPDTGAFRRERTPEGVSGRFPSTGALRAFRFAFKPDGNLEIEPKTWK